MSFEEVVNRAAKATVIVRVTNNPQKEHSFTTGFVVGQCTSLCIIMTVGHYLTPGSDTLLEVIFFGHADEAFGATVRLHLPESEILLLTVEKRDDIDTGKLIFESADNWKLRYLQLLASISHPCSLRWRAGLGIVNCPEFVNSDIGKYDSQMLLFDHSLQFGVGSSGAPLINEQGNVVGIQSGEISSTYLAMSGQPVSDALDSKRSKIVDLPFELIALYISELVYGYHQLHEITTIHCDLKQAVHIKYIDRVIRSWIKKEFTIDVSKGSLNDIIEQYIPTISSAGSSKRKLHLSRRSSSLPYSVRPSQPTCSRTYSSHAFDSPQDANVHDITSGGLVKADESPLSEHVRQWVYNGVNKPFESLCNNTVSDGWCDAKAKSEIVVSWKTAAAAAQKWNNYGDGERNRFDTLGSLHGKSVSDGLGVSKGNSKIVESWKFAYNAYERSKKGNSSENKSTIKYPPDKNGSNPKVSELIKEVTYSIKSYADKRMQYDNAGFEVKVFTQPHYLHNFVQSMFNALSADKVRGATLVVSGDGRYFSKEAIQIIIKMAAANGVRCVWVGQNGMLSTSAVSAVIRERVGADGSKASGAILLTTSRNPGGPNEAFGIKYYMENGGPAPERITDKIYENTKTIKECVIAEGLPDVDISVVGLTNFEGPEGQFGVDVFDSANDYVKLMKSIFDFQSIQKLVASPQFSFRYDALHGVSGAYAKRIFVDELGVQDRSLLICKTKENFGGGHLNINLTCAKELVARMGLGKSQAEQEPPEFGAAADSGADCHMIHGKRFFVTPSDSVAIIAANAVESIPYFSSGLKGVARSMPTSAALDVVAKHLNLKFFEVPTGLKFFGNLMDAGICSMWGEESFGTGSDHIREKDEIWAVLAWLSVLAYKNKENFSEKLVTVEDIVRQHWATYGRHYYTRYDYENVDAGAANKLMAHLVKLQSSLINVNNIVEGIRPDLSKVANADEFEYKDPVDGLISKHQGVRYLFEDGSRLVFRLSGTGSEGATIHLYVEQYVKDSSKIGRDPQEALAPLVDVALKLSKMQEFTGRSAPTVIT